MIFHGYRQIRESGEIRLFKSCNPEFKDGGQLRDFVYVKDICSVIKWLLENPQVNGLYNVGTGRAQSFRELAEATFHALGMEPDIKYIDMPDHLKKKYQYYTKAEMGKLRAAGYKKAFMDLEEGTRDYVLMHLNKDYLIF
jgi:ADP-L-glycero-D-manno-heptose 6-epimerase